LFIILSIDKLKIKKQCSQALFKVAICSGIF